MVTQQTNPQWIGGYHLLREIGRGGTGTVWEATDEGGTRVALKLLHPSLASTEQARQRLLREARLVNQVRSPRVARVLDVEADDYTPFVVTELVVGPTLEAEISRLPYRAEDAAQLASELATTLDTVHAAGMAHRDLKPSNVVLAKDGPTLIDFGIAQGEGDRQLTETGTITGTPGYVSPELLSSTARPTLDVLQAGDWFALAALALRAMTGRPPFGAGRPEVVLNRVIAGEPDTAGLDPRIAAAFTWALHPSPDRRLSPDDLIDCLAGAELVLDMPESTQMLPAAPPGDDTALFLHSSPIGTPRALPPPAEPVPVPLWAPDTAAFDLGAPAAPPRPSPPRATLALGVLMSLAWIPILWRPLGLAILATTLVALQFAGGVTLSTWQLRMRSRNRPSSAVRVISAPWRLLVALTQTIPGLGLGAAVAYFATLVTLAVTTGDWDLSSPWSWVMGEAETQGLIPVVWAAVLVGLLVWWGVPTSRKAQLGLGVALGPLSGSTWQRWVLTVALFMLTVIGLFFTIP